MIEDVESMVSLCLGLAGFLTGVGLWYRGAVQKSYAAQRDFEHLKRNYQQLSQVLKQISEQMDDLGAMRRQLEQISHTQTEIKATLTFYGRSQRR